MASSTRARNHSKQESSGYENIIDSSTLRPLTRSHDPGTSGGVGWVEYNPVLPLLHQMPQERPQTGQGARSAPLAVHYRGLGVQGLQEAFLTNTNMNTEMKFVLKPSDAMQKAMELVESGGGDVRSMEVVECILELTKDHPEKVSFVRDEGKIQIPFSHKEAGIALEHNIHILPYR